MLRRLMMAAGGSAPVVYDSLIFPLTYDELDATNTAPLTRSGGSGPHVTPDGFEGDGYSARYTTTALPAWVNSGAAFSLQASVNYPNYRARSSRDEIVSLGTNDGAAATRLGLSVMDDPKGAALVPAGAITLRAGAAGLQTQTLGRPGWRYEMRTPDLSVGGFAARPQGILFLDASTFMVSVHLSDTESVVYKVRLSDKAVLAQFSFGTTTYRHVASFARRSNGDIWAADYETFKLLRLDLDASFASGSAVILQTYDTSILAGASAIEFMTLGGTEYLLLGCYDTLDVDSWLYLIDVAELAGPTFALTDRFKRFNVGRRVQGVCARNGSLLVARNNKWGATSPSGVVGWIEDLNISGMASTLADGQSVHAGSNPTYITATHIGPSSYVEDMAIHPTTGLVYMPTEGGAAVGDSDGYLGVWSGALTQAGALNVYTLEYDGAGSLSVRINDQLFNTKAWTLDQTAAVLSIGGLPAAANGFTTGFAIGTIANLALVNGPIDSTLYAAISGGTYEASSLTSYTLTLTNPGAEAGSTAGWTVESGGMTTRTTNPLPFEGTRYFTGGSFVSSVSRQRVTLSAASVPNATLDAGTAWAKIRWHQAAYDNNDPGGMGIRALTGADATLATTYSGLAFTPFGDGAGTGAGPWYPRCYPVTLPTTTRKVDALYNASGRTAGTANDHYVDAISVTVYAP